MRPWLFTVALSGCSLFQGATEPHPPFFKLTPPRVDLPKATYASTPQFGSFLIENTGADTLYVSLIPSTPLPTIAEGDTDGAIDPGPFAAEDGSDLVVVSMAPHNALAPGQRDLIEVTLDPRTWRWSSGEHTPALQLEVGYFFSGQEQSEPEIPSLTRPPQFISEVYDLFVRYQIDCDLDKDGFDSTACHGTDCDDRLASVYPEAPERCDGFDGDCDGAVDEASEDQEVWFFDGDHDNYGDAEQSISACNRPSSSWISDGTDCDDELLYVHPNATEICDGIDNDCDGASDEGCN